MGKRNGFGFDALCKDWKAPPDLAENREAGGIQLVHEGRSRVLFLRRGHTHGRRLNPDGRIILPKASGSTIIFSNVLNCLRNKTQSCELDP